MCQKTNRLDRGGRASTRRSVVCRRRARDQTKPKQYGSSSPYKRYALCIDASKLGSTLCETNERRMDRQWRQIRTDLKLLAPYSVQYSTTAKIDVAMDAFEHTRTIERQPTIFDGIMVGGFWATSFPLAPSLCSSYMRFACTRSECTVAQILLYKYTIADVRSVV